MFATAGRSGKRAGWLGGWLTTGLALQSCASAWPGPAAAVPAHLAPFLLQAEVEVSQKPEEGGGEGGQLSAVLLAA